MIAAYVKRAHDEQTHTERRSADRSTAVWDGVDTQSLVDQDPPALLRSLAALPRSHPSRQQLRARVVEAWLPLAHHLANRLTGRGEHPDDLRQIAALGLIKAVDRFDPARGVEFAAFAVPTITGEIKRHFRDHTWDVRVPRRVQELRIGIAEATGTLLQELGRTPTRAEVAAHLGVSEEAVREGVKGACAYSAVSMQVPVQPDGTTELGDLMGEEDHNYVLVEYREALASAMSALDERSQRIVILRFYGNMTQSQIAEEIGISQMHVSRLLSRALATLAEAM